MELSDMFYNATDYIQTASGNKVCKKSVLCGSQRIVLLGKTIIETGCIIRGDLANVKIGRNCVVGKRAVVRPAFKIFAKGQGSYLPINIGDNVFIGEDSIINAGQIGSYVFIGKNCIISKYCVLRDCCAIADNTVLPAGTVVPAFSVYSGCPALFTKELPECTQDIMIDFTQSYYEHFKPKSVT